MGGIGVRVRHAVSRRSARRWMEAAIDYPLVSYVAILHARELLIVSALALAVSCGAPQPSSHSAAAGPAVEKVQTPYKTFVSLEEAKPLLSADPADVPAALRGTPEQQAAAWPSWVVQHDAEIRARLERGDEDSIVNLWFYGTTFTRLPRATDRDLMA